MVDAADKPAEPYYQRQAKDFIDVLFDKGYFATNVKRDEMRCVEDLLAYCFQSQSEAAVMSTKLLQRAKRTASG